ncbi:hypothetical protein CDAR_555421 [Caerostris darwini]|uniref:Uncharacterized protein n=1 Tax=Caerostris darwini TaxID=1538125 RepID=A0AAV4QAN7_9ARAC|nr:hypothetical protein CDAR_555421 [Caerostris darwini]
MGHITYGQPVLSGSEYPLNSTQQLKIICKSSPIHPCRSASGSNSGIRNGRTCLNSFGTIPLNGRHHLRRNRRSIISSPYPPLSYSPHVPNVRVWL